MVVVMNREFPAYSEAWDGRWRRFRCPIHVPVGGIGPGVARCIIDWCRTTNQDLLEVDYQGRVVRA